MVGAPEESQTLAPRPGPPQQPGAGAAEQPSPWETEMAASSRAGVRFPQIWSATSRSVSSHLRWLTNSEVLPGPGIPLGPLFPQGWESLLHPSRGHFGEACKLQLQTSQASPAGAG